MLQQTQVARAIPKYEQFLTLFPTATSLAATPLGDVLRAWSGLGYNRRAKYLWQAAQQLSDSFPTDIAALVQLPGIGPNTAGAVLAYSFNQPVVFIETNIRTVFIHHFFNDQIDVTDKSVLEIVATTLDIEHPREWYWALMDYGAFLKQTVGNLNQQSKHYAKQSKFEGSKRQIRGEVLRQLAVSSQTVDELAKNIVDNRLRTVIEDLLSEGMIHQSHDKLEL
ncbi:MAG TPA: hypothetical protein VG992_02945 [Candidatus Saccharimonadales bacterium]|nr:hypothetical protein [Candidatus Saccharimonadales bacterium]